METIIENTQRSNTERQLVVAARTLYKSWHSQAFVQDALLETCIMNLNMLDDLSDIKNPDFVEEMKTDLHALRGLRNPISRYFKYLKIVWAIYGWLIVP